MGEKDMQTLNSYGMDYVAIIPKSPTSLFIYWELKGERSRLYTGKHDARIKWRLILKNISESGKIRHSSEITVDPDVGNHYLKVQPDSRYRVELGVKIGEAFHPVCHSRERKTPGKAPEGSKLKKTSRPLTTVASHPLNGKRNGEQAPRGLVWDATLTDGSSYGA